MHEKAKQRYEPSAIQSSIEADIDVMGRREADVNCYEEWGGSGRSASEHSQNQVYMSMCNKPNSRSNFKLAEEEFETVNCLQLSGRHRFFFQ